MLPTTVRHFSTLHESHMQMVRYNEFSRKSLQGVTLKCAMTPPAPPGVVEGGMMRGSFDHNDVMVGNGGLSHLLEKEWNCAIGLRQSI